MVILGIPLSGFAQGSAALPATVPVAELVEQADAAFAERSYSRAHALYRQGRQQVATGSADYLELRFLELATRLLLDRIHPDEALEGEDRTERLQELERHAKALQAQAGGAAGRWLRLYEIAAFELEIERDSWRPLSTLLAHWARSTEIERAREEYLRLIWRASREGRNSARFQRADRREWVLNATRLARSPEEQAAFNLLLAETYPLWSSENAEFPLRRGNALERAIAAGPETTAYAEALWRLGQWAERFGAPVYDEAGRRAYHADFVRAAGAYRRLLATENPGWARWREQAKQALERLGEEELDVLVNYSFRPEAEVQFGVRWRNLPNPEVEIYEIDALVHVPSRELYGEQPPPPLPESEAVYRAIPDQSPERPHYPVITPVRLGEALPPGAYAIVARSGDALSWMPLFVTDFVVVTHRTPTELVAFVADAETGEPQASFPARLVMRPTVGNGSPVTTQVNGISDENGLIRFVWPEGTESRTWHWQLTVDGGEEKGVASLQSRHWQRREAVSERSVFLMPDRSLYGPGDSVRIGGWLRERVEGVWSPPRSEGAFSYVARSMNGEFEERGDLAVSVEGSFALDLELPEDAPLGLYFVRVEQGERNYWDGSRGALFRVEEFRVPEILAEIHFDHSPDEPLLPGDLIEGSVNVAYYSGGAVEDAAIELVVSRRPFFPSWTPLRGESSLAGTGRMPFAPSTGVEIARQQLETDARGNVRFEVSTERETDQDWSYLIEARVRDLSRREVVVSRSTHITRQSYFARLEVAHRIIAPDDIAQLTVTLEDANGSPVSDDGIVRVERDRWREVYVHRRRGSEITGEQYRELPERSMLGTARSDYRLREAGFVTEEVLVAEILAGEDGKAYYRFQPPEAGYYKFEWVSRGQRGQPVTASVPLWVADEASAEIGYRPGGVQLIADRGPHALGRPVPVMVAAPDRERTVFLTISGAKGVAEHRVLQLEGSSRLFTITPGQGHQPNFFIDASLVSNEEHFVDTLELLVPPRQQYLDLQLLLAAEGYEPGDRAKLEVFVRDAAGKAVETELLLAGADEALDAIQPSLRPHVRDVFYSERNTRQVTPESSLRNQPFFAPLSDPAPDEAAVDVAETVQLGSMSASSRGLAVFDAAAPAPPPLSVLGEEFLKQAGMLVEEAAAGELPGAESAIAVRRNFRSTLHWSGIVRTDADGRAEIELDFPDNLTSWKLSGVAVDAGTRVGEAETTVPTRLPLIGRLQVPRFLVERDEAILSGIFQNNTYGSLAIRPSLEGSGPIHLMPAEGGRADYLSVPPSGIRRVDWRVRAESSGASLLQLTTRGDLAGDAVERSLRIVPHGARKMEGLLGRVPGGEAVELALELPAEGEASQARLRLKASASLAPQLFGALPYLIEYPYGGTEQTLSRFLPALMVRRTAQNLGVPLSELDTSVFASLSREAIGSRSDLREVLDAVTKEGVERLAETQKKDGSWPWMPEGPSDPHMTAYAVWSLSFAQELGMELEGIRLDEARAWLERMLVERDLSLMEETWMLTALSSRYRVQGYGRPSRMEARSFLEIMNLRDELPPMGLGMLALSARYFGFDDEARILLRNLADSARASHGTLSGATDASGQPLSLPTVHWGRRDRYFDWSEGAVESTAFILHALLSIEPEHPWVEAAVSWLSRNRTGMHWPNTRSTAVAVLVLTDYLAQVGGDVRESVFRVSVNGEPVGLNGDANFSTSGWMPLMLDLPLDAIEGREARVKIERTDEAAPYYFELFSEYFDTEEDIRAATSDLVLTREYWHLKPVPTLLDGIREVMTPLRHGEPIGSGDRMEVVLRIEAPRDLRYVLVEDRRAAGLEAVQLLSGPSAVAREVPAGSDSGPAGSGRQLRGYQELRDRHVAFLFQNLPEGSWEIRYRLRAETPGRFHGMPAEARPMYLPHVGANSAEWLIEVTQDDD